MMKILSHTNKYKQVAWVHQCCFWQQKGGYLRNSYAQFPQSTFRFNHQLLILDHVFHQIPTLNRIQNTKKYEEFVVAFCSLSISRSPTENFNGESHSAVANVFLIQLRRPFLQETTVSLGKEKMVKWFLLNMLYSNWTFPNEDIYLQFPCSTHFLARTNWADEVFKTAMNIGK